MTFTVTASSKKAGTATITNKSTGQTVSHSFSGETNQLCEYNAEWIVEDYDIARHQAALLMAMVAQAGICQISNTDYTAYCVAPRGVWRPYAR